MTTPFEDLANLDKLIHEPARLALLTALSACESADFLTKLEEAGLVNIQKQFVAKKPSTQLKITKKGLTAIQHHWEQLNAIKQSADAWEDDSANK